MLADKMNSLNNSRDFAVRVELAKTLFECQGFNPVSPEEVAARYSSADEMVASMSITQGEYSRLWEACR